MVRRTSKNTTLRVTCLRQAFTQILEYHSGCDRLGPHAGDGVDSLSVWYIAMFSTPAKGSGDDNVFAYTLRSRQLVHILPVHEANSSTSSILPLKHLSLPTMQCSPKRSARCSY
jgi:hypothetical protein